MLIGELAHQFLENWDFGGDKNLLRHQLGAFLSASLSAEYSQDAGSIGEELQTIFERFINSHIYTELRRARILGREVPLLMPWNGQIMEGVIDLIYERNGLLYLADYKTDTGRKQKICVSARNATAGKPKFIPKPRAGA